MAMSKSVTANDLFSFSPLVKCPLPDLVDRSVAVGIKNDLAAINPPLSRMVTSKDELVSPYDKEYNSRIRAVAPCVYFKPVSESDGTNYGNIVRDPARVSERSDMQLSMVLKYTCDEQGNRLFTDFDTDRLHKLPSSVFYDMVNVLVGTLARIPTSDIDSDPTGLVPAGDSSTE